MNDEILMAMSVMTPDDLLHHGVKGMKWGQHLAGANAGGGSAENVDEMEEAINEAEEELAELEAEKDPNNSKKISELKKQIQAGKERVNKLKKTADKLQNGTNLSHNDYTPDELYHHGILGMKWGVRRFQPYQPGARVKGGKEVGLATKVKQKAGNVVEHYKKNKVARQKAAIAKKAAATRKANAEHQAAKQKAIEKGSAQELLKFKSELSNDDINKALNRLATEKRLEDVANASKKSGLDYVDSLMSGVNRLSGYVNTAAGMYESMNRLSKAAKAREEMEEEEKTAQKRKKIEKLVAKGNIDALYRRRNSKYVTDDDLKKALNKHDDAIKLLEASKRKQIDKLVRDNNYDALKDNKWAKAKDIKDVLAKRDAIDEADYELGKDKRGIYEAIRSGNVAELTKASNTGYYDSKDVETAKANKRAREMNTEEGRKTQAAIRDTIKSGDTKKLEENIANMTTDQVAEFYTIRNKSGKGGKVNEDLLRQLIDEALDKR